jgi:hypothetical protein
VHRRRRQRAYLIDGTLPAAGTSCRQDVPFLQPQLQDQALARSSGSLMARHQNLARNSKPLLQSAR